MKPFDTDKMPWLFTPHGDGELNEYFSTDHSKIIAETSKEVLASLSESRDRLSGKPNLSKPARNAVKMPYLLKNLKIEHPNQVWAIDITYISMKKSHMYLTAVIDWNTRFIVGYALSDTLDAAPVLEAVKKAVRQYGSPEIINSDQGSQFTSEDYTGWLKEKQIRQSMDGKARWVDNVIIERWFRSLKCELIYINEFQTPRELRQAIGNYIHSYNTERPHASLDYHYPADLYLAA